MDAADLRMVLDAGPLLGDGGTGTSLIAGGAPTDACLEGWNLREPDAVTAVHRAFVEAGARLILTNTFGADRFRLERFGLADRVEAICTAGADLARRAGAELVGGSIGPLGVRLAPYGRVPSDDVFAAYREQAAALSRAGVDLLVVETQTDIREIELAVRAARDAAPGLALAVSATFTRDDRTPLGSTPAQVAAALAALGVDAIGVNCGEGPAQALRIVRVFRGLVGDLPISAWPNAGGPAEMGGRLVYPATPDYVAEVGRALLDEGVAILGGCCGTGPAHTAALAATLRDRGTPAAAHMGRPRAGVEVARTPDDDEARGEHVVATQASSAPVREDPAPTSFEAALVGGDLVVAVEMEPPRSFNAAELVAAATTLRDAGADVIDVADSPMAKMRMSAWAACRLVQERVGIDTVLHFPTRGRNLLRLQGDLLGAHALGIRNLFVCVGDPVTVGDYPQTLNDVDVTATGLLALVTAGFNAGVDRAGSSIGEPTTFFAGAALAPTAPDLEREVKLLRTKVANGARFLLSQPVYGVEPLRAVLRAYAEASGAGLDVPVLVGILPLASARHARFLHNEVPGVVIPEAALARMERAGSGDGAWREGLSMAEELVEALRDEGVAGIYVMPQFGRYDRAAELVEAAKRAVAMG